MNLWAISDLHVGFAENRRAVEELAASPDDWLIVAGDTGESPAHLDFVLRTLTPRFAQIIWTPGNHDLWTPRSLDSAKRGDAHYQRLVNLCRTYGVLTPEDPYAIWPASPKRPAGREGGPGEGPRIALAPAFLLYDYTFRPDDVAVEDAVEWAAQTGVRCADEDLLAADPYPSREAWCHARVDETEKRLDAIPADTRIVLIAHWPLRRDHAIVPRVPRFSIWCGTRRTEDWHRRYPIDVVVHGHLHLRSTRTLDGVRFEEVSLGYPKQWNVSKGLQPYLRRII